MINLTRSSLVLLSVGLLGVSALAETEKKDMPSSSSSKPDKAPTAADPTGSPVISTSPGGHGGGLGATGAATGSGSTGTSGAQSTGGSGTTSAGTDNKATGATGGAR